MTQQTDYRKYLSPQMLARVSSFDLRARLIVEGLTNGVHRSPFQGISVEFAQHRQYAHGDDIRHVDWKMLAKTDKIYLKQYLQETNLQLICVVDASQSMSYGTVMADKDGSPIPAHLQTPARSSLFRSDASSARWTKYDHATAISAALSYLTIHQQDSAGLAVFDSALTRFIRPSNSSGQWRLITAELQKTPQRGKTNLGKVLSQLAEKLTHRSVIIILSDLFDDFSQLSTGLRQLRYKKHDLVVFQILDPTEIDFPFKDFTHFQGLEESGQLVADPRSLRESYLQRLKELTDQLQKMCRGMHIDFARMNTADSLEVSLSTFLANRAASMR